MSWGLQIADSNEKSGEQTDAFGQGARQSSSFQDGMAAVERPMASEETENECFPTTIQSFLTEN
jgi:hypothetical protein